MATQTAPTPSAHSAPPERPPLWQAPVFVLGVGALVAVWLGRPLWPDTEQRRLEHDLAEARQILSRAHGDADKARRLAARAVETAQEINDRVGEATLLLGTAQMRLAERADGSRAAELWREARATLAEAEQLGVPEADEPALQFRLGKAGYHTDDDLAQVIARLEKSVEQGDNKAEGYGLLTQAYLKLPTPDLQKALAANQKLRDVADASEAELSAAKLLGAQLQMRLGHPDEARKSLEKISDQADPALLAQARLLRARSYQEEGKWGLAATQYVEALADGRAPLPDLARVYYDLGTCYKNRNQPCEAAKAWKKCVALGPGVEASAAALAAAEVMLQEREEEKDPQHKSPEKVLELLTGAVAKVDKPDEWVNSLADVARARQVFEGAAAAFAARERFDLVLKLAGAYERVAEPGKAALVRGKYAAEWAAARHKRGAEAGDDAERQAEEKEARGLYKQAGDAYAEAADKQPGLADSDKAELLWQSANNFLACDDHAAAIEKLEQLLKLTTDSARLGEGHYRLGEARLKAGNAAGARDAFVDCLKYVTRYAYLARYRLARAALDVGDLDEAEAALTLNLKLLRFDPDLEAQEKSLVALGGLLYQRRNYRSAKRSLEEVREHFKDHPESVRIQYMLADCYRQIAAQENQRSLLREKMTREAREHFQGEHRRWLQKAAEEFGELMKVLDSPGAMEQLSAEQRSQVPFIAAKCRFYLGEYQAALEIYKDLITRHQGKPEELDALGGAISCHAGLGQIDMVRQRLVEISKSLDKMDDAVRKPWEAWVAEATERLNSMDKPHPDTNGAMVGDKPEPEPPGR